MAKKRIKILYLIDRITPGGTENQIVLIVNNLPKEKFNAVIGVLEDNEFQDNMVMDGKLVKFTSYAPKYIKNIIKLLKIIRYIKNNNIDIVQTHFPTSEIYGTIAVKMLRAKPLLINTRRNNYHWVNDRPFIFCFTKMAVQSADYVLTNSYNVEKECQKREGVESRKIKVIQNAIDIKKFNPSIEVYKDYESCAHPIIGVVANWRFVKGVDVFLKAAAIVAKKIESANFILIGYGPREKELKELALKLNLSGKTKFIRSPSNIHELIKKFDIAVQPSRNEAFSNVILEYMALKKPIVATNVGDNKRIVLGNEAGIIIEPDAHEEMAQAILYLYHNKENAEKMGCNGAECVKKFWATGAIIKNYKDFYQKILSDKGYYRPKK